MTLIDVATVAIALDANARPAIQAAMRKLAETGNTATSEGRALLLQQALEVLAAHTSAFTHAFIESTVPLPLEEARPRFVEAATRARSRFGVEVIRNADGTTTTAAPPTFAPRDEPGVVLVTVVVARRREVPDVAQLTRAALDATLRELGTTTAAELVAMEVIWSPAEEADRVSAAELSRRHPEIRPLEALA